MKKYNVTVIFDGAVSYHVEADSVEEAEEKAYDLFEREDPRRVSGNVMNTDAETTEEP